MTRIPGSTCDEAVAPSPAADPTITRQVARLATPVLIEQVLLYLVGLSDTVLTGRYLSADHLAAVTVSSYLLWFLGSLLTVVSVGGTALVARRVGMGRWGDANRTCRQAIGLAILLGTAIAVVGWLVAPSAILALNQRGTAAAVAIPFLRIILAVTPLLACTTVGIACLRGAGDTRTGMWVMILVNAINIALSWTLVQGVGPVPALGFVGIALGTAIGEGTGGLVILAVLWRGRSGLRLDARAFAPDWPEVRSILRISLPAAGESLTTISCQLWFLALIGRLGATATAAHGVAIRCESIAFLTVTAFAVAASTLTGQNLGRGRPDLAARASRIAWGLGVAVLAALGVLIYTQAAPMFALFTAGRQPEVAATGIPAVRIVAFAMPALATIMVLTGSLRGAGDTRWPWAIVVLGFLGVRLPLAYWLTGAGTDPVRGLRGAWIAMLADLCVRAVLVASRFLHGGWKTTRV